MAKEISLRQQLLEAQNRLSRQIEIMQSPATVMIPGGRWAPDNRGVLGALQAQLNEVRTALAQLQDDD
jgi:hypothetical protein